MNQRPIRPKTLKDLEEGIEEKLHDIGFVNNFVKMTPKSKGNKRQNKLDFIKSKGFCTSKEYINRVKMQPTEWEKCTCKSYIWLRY